MAGPGYGAQVFEPGIGGLRTSKYPTPFDPTANYFAYFGAQIGLSTSGWPCTTCTTGFLSYIRITNVQGVRSYREVRVRFLRGWRRKL